MAKTVITFDCYGTLVAWQERTALALGGILAGKAGAERVRPVEFVAAFHRIRHAETGGPYRLYKEILTASLEKTLTAFALPFVPADGECLLAGVRTIAPFAEVPAVLEVLRRDMRIAIVSNSDRDIIVHNLRHIGVPFDHVFVAEDAGAYKPSPILFAHVLERIGCAPEDVIHVGASCVLDMEPAAALGLDAVWINRRGDTATPGCRPAAVLPDLSGLPEVVARLNR